MKKSLIALACMLLLVSTSAFGITLQAGIDTEFVLDRDVNLQNAGVEADYTAQYYDLTLESKIGLLTLVSKAGLTTSQLSADVFNTDVDLNSGIGWNIGVDAQADVYRSKYVDVALIGGYRFSRVDIDEIEIGALSIDNPLETTLYMHEWEAGVQVSKNLKEFGIPVIPYFGLVYSDMQGNMDVNLSVIEVEEEIEADKNVGVRVGFKTELIPYLTCSVDAKFFDQTAVMGSVSYMF